MSSSFQTAPASPTPPRGTGSRTAVVPRLLALAALGTLSLAACSAGGGTGGQDSSGGSSTASGTTSSATAGGSPSTGTASPAPASTGAPSGSAAAAPDGEGPIVPGAANDAWMKQARKAVATTDPESTTCLDGLLDQTMLDAVATYLPQVGTIALGGLRHQAGCTFTAPGDGEDGPSVEVKRMYIANDTTKTMDGSGLPGSDMCAPGRDQDENGVSTESGDAVASRGPGGTTQAAMRGAWSCSEDGGIGSAFVLSAGSGSVDVLPDPALLTEPAFAVAAATHLHDTEVDWAPTLDDLYEANFKANLGQ